MEDRFAAVRQYLREKHPLLANDYAPVGKGFNYVCGFIAVAVADVVIDCGGAPTIYKFRSHGRGYIFPNRYNGRVQWGSHQACVQDGVVYDPVLGEPVPLQEYPLRMFGEPVSAVMRHDAQKTAQFVNEGDAQNWAWTY